MVSSAASRQVLDHGLVELLDVMGDDAEPARAARVSYGHYAERPWEKDAKLIRYLWEHGHTSPFEMVELKWRIRAPIFVARQWMRHRTANVNEFSMRYADAGDVYGGEIRFYTPERWRRTSAANKQSSTGTFPGNLNAEMREDQRALAETAIRGYRKLIDAGVAPEMARIVLPVSVYSEWIWKNDLHNTLHFLKLRSADGAQWEIQQYANAMVELLRERLPKLMEIVWHD